VVDKTIADLLPHLECGDILIDGGNSYYIDDIRRAKELAPKGIHYVDVGTAVVSALAPGEHVAHAVEETATAWGGLAAGGMLKFLDAGVGALERLVLDQDRLHQRINRVRRVAEPFADHALGVGIAALALQRRKAVQQVGDHLSFLRSHCCSPLAGWPGAAFIWGALPAPEVGVSWH
jgi:hypothetical protein